MDKKLTDTEIKKVLECCHGQYEADCENCPNKNTCGEIDVIQQTLDLINRLQAKNTELLEKIKKLQDEYRWLDQESDILAADVNALNHFLETAKAEAYKEFAERLKEKAWDADTRIGYVQVVDVGSIDDLLKEMGVDGKEGET